MRMDRQVCTSSMNGPLFTGCRFLPLSMSLPLSLYMSLSLFLCLSLSLYVCLLSICLSPLSLYIYIYVSLSLSLFLSILCFVSSLLLFGDVEPDAEKTEEPLSEVEIMLKEKETLTRRYKYDENEDHKGQLGQKGSV